MILYFMYSIIYAMAVNCSRAGRPCLVADIDQTQDKVLAFQDEFFEACANLRYGECMALSRALGISYLSVLKWKYKIRCPRKDMAEEVILWVEQGKPMKQVRPFPENAGMV